MHITSQHASSDDDGNAEKVLLDNSPTSTEVVPLKGDTTRTKITESSITNMAFVDDKIILKAGVELKLNLLWRKGREFLRGVGIEHSPELSGGDRRKMESMMVGTVYYVTPCVGAHS